MEGTARVKRNLRTPRRRNRGALLFSGAFLALAFLTGGSKIGAEEGVRLEGAENLGSVNWSGNDYAPQISPDGRFLIFQSDRPAPFNDHNLWFSVNRNYRTNKLARPDWTAPIPLRFPYLDDPIPSMRVVRPPGTLKEPEGAFTVNSDGFEGMASLVYRNGNPVEIYFTSLRDRAANRDGYDGLNIYFSRYRNQRWSEPTHLNVINSHFDDRMPAISQDGEHLYFSSNRPGGYGGYDIWYAVRDLKTGEWSRPINLGEEVNTQYNEIAPSLMSQGSLVFSSDRPGGIGSYDLYLSRYSAGERLKAVNLGYPFNTPRDDEYLSVTEDGLWGYLASDRRDLSAAGQMDLYRVYLPENFRDVVSILFTGLILDGSTRDPLGVEATIQIDYEKETLVVRSSPFQKSPDMARANNFAVHLNSGRNYRARVTAPGFYPVELILHYKGNIPPGNTDRRIIVMKPVSREVTGVRRSVTGVVIDDETGLTLPGSFVEYTYPGSDSKTAEVDREGEFNLNVTREKPFTVTVRAPGYELFRKEYVENGKLKRIEIRLKKAKQSDVCPGEAPECIDNLRIYFDTDSAAIRKDQINVFDAIVRVMKAHPEIKIEIQGHTDRTYRGKKKDAFEYNKRLSELRARSVFKQLDKMGVDARKMSIRGFSYLHPMEKESNPKARSLNRRVEFRRILQEKN